MRELVLAYAAKVVFEKIKQARKKLATDGVLTFT